eukprot:Lithocolla_globosa_v1_NODE_5635_length_1207_cov_13.632812.p2 type:complete len:179 gc:universal NODE_5635_length_1207_cov_13.632812:760-224(-)
MMKVLLAEPNRLAIPQQKTIIHLCNPDKRGTHTSTWSCFGNKSHSLSSEALSDSWSKTPTFIFGHVTSAKMEKISCCLGTNFFMDKGKNKGERTRYVWGNWEEALRRAQRSPGFRGSSRGRNLGVPQPVVVEVVHLWTTKTRAGYSSPAKNRLTPLPQRCLPRWRSSQPSTQPCGSSG